jgi:hypothetical protein
VVGAIITILLLCAVMILAKDKRAQVSILNRTDSIIAEAQIKVRGQVLNFRNIKPGESKTAKYYVTTDDDFNTVVKLENGQILTGHFGYIDGLQSEDTIIVEPNGLKIQSTFK